ncbi:3-hydroxyacyl-CoA dehydrogenase [Oleiphilus sp. HI0071]|nr:MULTISPECIES: 3-hydroxyacyl-CoA dehydrogenase NAD-binding domain-containing protein [unclassified Oleiphilus]KZY70936.1 3-hydroxyacyl-CoA dehydrogenase [Oleiphilus sp. HI0065]KZY82439.1 3-hydroxyacyl-CoA dehydrogenase [Oleiphilus sp. HI0071]KZZ03816.1 3-hydroxyacyl-CoA dehydrogenase [Oleiphilus sp. HI0073]KZZ40574.1 3-hydroxyacyl-CoA dehydrogenase [Oleiphilus sp. HI0118]KZZ52246.1 3-hydroxyacyl-CoA dehydrogenase [Oleiphilus sp. HI0122]KZZ78733.1 3-hydroxyacyl-CoA dehydrogenase [Oleiphilus 
MSSVIYEKDQDNIVHLILDKPNSSANLMDQEFTESLCAAVEKLKADEFAGVIFRSNKSTFFAGGNLDDLYATTRENAKELYDMVQSIKVAMRYLETCGKPVVACINGAALGGGWELALACHHRIALSEGVKLGLPEVTLGLLPGGGGVVRMSRLLGLQAALPYLTEGKQFKPEKGKELGLIHDIVDTEDQLLDAATSFIKANLKAQQPYDVKGYKVPGGKPSTPALAKMLPIAPAMMRDKTKGVLPAPEAILSVMVESLQVDIDSAMRIETRYFVELVCGQVSKNMINTFWYQLNEINAGAARPAGIEKAKFTKLGVLGAGMMGAGIAYSAATRGIEVVLKDVSLESAEKGKAYSENLLDKKVKRGRLSASKRNETLALIHPTENAEDLAGCDMIIEAVFEDRGLKAKVTQEAEAQMQASGVFASNTSTLPITGLAEASARPEQFIGLHFFSPVDKMPLVEIICGAQTSDETLARAYDFVQQISKVPIVVNDSRGFYTSRVFGTYANEGIAMLGEGVSPSAVENAAFLSGFPVSPLAVTDEVSMTLMEKIRNQTIKDLEAEGKPYRAHPADAVVDKMLEASRPGKLAGGGFYEYPKNGKKHLWNGLPELFGGQADFELKDLQDRLLYIQAIETVRCLEEKVLTSVRDANIGSIMGIGYPVWTGGILQFINQTGITEFVARAEALHETYGERFAVPALLKEMAASGNEFKDAD